MRVNANLDAVKDLVMLYDLEFNHGFLKKGQAVELVDVGQRHPRSKVRILTIKDSDDHEFLVTNREVEKA
jgi:hypothetical protein